MFFSVANLHLIYSISSSLACATAFIISAFDITGVPLIVFTLAFLSVDHHFGILAAGVAEMHSLRRRRPLPMSFYSDKPSVGCTPRDDMWCVIDAP